MKTSSKTALLALAAALVSQGAFAAANDLILGFNQQGVSTFDYTVNLGNYQTSVGVGGATVQDLSSLLGPLNAVNGFNSAFTGGPNGVAAGVAGGNGGVGTKDVFATSLRTLTGNPAAQAGSTTPTTLGNGGLINTAGNLINGVTPLGKLSSSDGSSWSTLVAPNSTDITTPGNYATTLQFNPMSIISGSSIVEDLWQNTRSSATGPALGWDYLGYFSLTFLDANTASLTFTPETFVPVPEPATYGLLAGAGLLALCFRRQLSRSNA